MIPTRDNKHWTVRRTVAALLGIVAVLTTAVLTYPLLSPSDSPSPTSPPVDSMPESRAESAPSVHKSGIRWMGRVLDTVDRPIAGASVALEVFDSANRQWIEFVKDCDGTGSFLVEGSFDGAVGLLDFRAPGYVSKTHFPQPNSPSHLGTIRLEKGAWTLTGTVKQRDGSPHGDSILFCTLPCGKARPERHLPLAQIDPQGHFTLKGLPLCDLDVYALIRGGLGPRSRARRIRNPGPDGVVSIDLVLEGSFAVQGQLLDADGSTEKRLEVEALDTGDAFAGSTYTDEAGRFTLHAPESVASLTFRVRRFRKYVADIPWTRGQDEGPSIQLPAKQVQRKLRFNVTESGAPIASNSVRYRVSTHPDDDEGFARTYRRPDEIPRMFEVMFAPYPNEDVKLTVDSRDHYLETVATSQKNAESSVLEVALRRSSTIRGILTGMDSNVVVAPLTIELSRADASGTFGRLELEDPVSHADPGSSFAAYHLTPGRYRVDILPSRYSGTHRFEVVVKDPGVLELRQVIPTFGALEGSVAWEREPEEVKIHVTIQRGDQPPVAMDLYLQGSFSLERLDVGEYTVSAEARKRNGSVWRDSKTVQVRRQQTATVALHLTSS